MQTFDLEGAQPNRNEVPPPQTRHVARAALRRRDHQHRRGVGDVRIELNPDLNVCSAKGQSCPTLEILELLRRDQMIGFVMSD